MAEVEVDADALDELYDVHGCAGAARPAMCHTGVVVHGGSVVRAGPVHPDGRCG
jgi:hypothetical protein